MLTNRPLRMLLCCCICILPAVSLWAQPQDSLPQSWKTGAGIGLDFTQLLQINPKQGAGQNRIGIGGAANVFAEYSQERIEWSSQGSWQFGIQRIGAGVVAQGAGAQTAPVPFQKAADELRLSSKYGYQTSDSSQWFYAANFTFISQLTPSYLGSDNYPGNFLVDVFETGQFPLSQFLAPATSTLSIGIDYKPTEALSFYYSPVGAKFIIVADDSIAARGVHGNPVRGKRNPQTGLYEDFDKIDAQIGSLLKADYNHTLLDEKLILSSSLVLYSNYLRNPQNIDLDWTNQFAYELFKNLQLTLLLNTFYDDDVFVQVTDFNAPNGVRGLGKRLSFTQQFLLKYAVVF